MKRAVNFEPWCLPVAREATGTTNYSAATGKRAGAASGNAYTRAATRAPRGPLGGTPFGPVRVRTMVLA